MKHHEDKNPRQHQSDERGRRSFLQKSLLGGALLAIAPGGLRAQTDECEPTARDFYGEGPFYSGGAPTRHVLALPEEKGQRIFLDGTVYANDCLTPLSDVILDIWHADDSGCYSRFENCENLKEDEYKLRGIIRTGETGAFSLETIKPGYYLNGAQYRPSHIHLKARHPEVSELVTQLYFEGDPYIDIDPAASRPDAAGRIIPMEEKENGLYGTFDIVLDVQPTSSAPTTPGRHSETRLRQNHPNPATRSTRIPFVLAQRSAVLLSIHNIGGEMINTLLNTTMSAGTHTIDWNLTDNSGRKVTPGSYVCRLRAGNTYQARTLTIL